MTQKERRDALDSILDSINMDDTMEKKIDDFARNKQRLKRIERARQNAQQFQRTYGMPEPKPFDESKNKEKEIKSVSQEQFPRYAARETLIQDVKENKPKDINLKQEALDSTQYYPSDETDLTLISSAPLSVSDLMPQNLEEYSGDTIVADPDLNETRVFSHPQPGVEPQQGADEDSTKPMSPEEIQELLDEDDKDFLKREYIGEEKAGSATPEKPSKKFNWKIASIVILLLVGIASGVGIYFMMNSASSADQPTETQVALFKSLEKWAKNYKTASDEEKKKIIELNAVYSKLTDDQKREINKLLEAETGKNFDKLYADALSASKPDSSADITTTAEKKAKLKGELQGLESQRDSLFKDVEKANEEYRNYQSTMDQLASPISQANDNLKYYNQQAEYVRNTISQKQSEINEHQLIMTQLQGQLSAAQSSESPDQGLIDQINSQIAAQKAAYEKAKAQLDQAKLEEPTATNNESKAQSEYDRLIGEFNDAQQKRNETSSKIDQLNEQIKALDDSIAKKKSEIEALE